MVRAFALLLCFGWMISPATAQESLWKRTDSDERYLHRIELRDASGRVLHPGSESEAKPHLGSTCSPCHDVEAASGGLHGGHGPDGRPGEPWILSDPRSATHLPIHRRNWPGILKPDAIGLDDQKWLEWFGRHDTGSGSTSDCLVCHLGNGYDFSSRIEQINGGNTSLASFIAAGLVDQSGQLDALRFDSSGKVELNLLGDAGNQACLRCHTVRDLQGGGEERWLHENDVHLDAGLTCVDCHRSGIDHHIVRGFEGEAHPSGADVSTLSCRGCHLDPRGGSHGAPIPEHRGLPPFHLDEISCTACHAGPLPGDPPVTQWTSRSHGLGETSQKRIPGNPPRIIAASLQRDDQQQIGPVRLTWPDGWGVLEADGTITMLSPDELRRPLRKALRIRADLIGEISSKLEDPDASALLAGALQQLQESLEPAKEAILITGGRIWRSVDGERLQPSDSPSADAVSWALAHPVRPARSSLGSGGCSDCHSTGSNWLSEEIGAEAMLPLQPIAAASSPLDREIIDPGRWNRWSLLFSGRDIGKIYFSLCAFVAISGGLLRTWRAVQEQKR